MSPLTKSPEDLLELICAQLKFTSKKWHVILNLSIWYLGTDWSMNTKYGFISPVKSNIVDFILTLWSHEWLQQIWHVFMTFLAGVRQYLEPESLGVTIFSNQQIKLKHVNTCDIIKIIMSGEQINTTWNIHLFTTEGEWKHSVFFCNGWWIGLGNIQHPFTFRQPAIQLWRDTNDCFDGKPGKNIATLSENLRRVIKIS